MSLPRHSSFKSKEEWESYLANFVFEMWDTQEKETMPDRDRWTETFNLFAGKMDWDEEREEQEWMSRPFLHEFSTVVRRVAEEMVNLVFEREDFFEMLPADKDNLGNTELARIFKKIMRYDLDKLELVDLFYEFCVAGSASGLGILKLFVKPQVSWDGETILERIEKQEIKDRKQLENIVVNKDKLPEEEELLNDTIISAVTDLLGSDAGQPLKRTIAKKKRLEMVLDASVVDPRNFAFEADIAKVKNSKFKIERIDKKFYELENEFKSGVFDRDKRDDLLKNSDTKLTSMGQISSYETQKLDTRDQLEQKSVFRRRVEILDYYGPLILKDGSVPDGYENIRIIVGNGKVILKACYNPNYDQKDPYVIATFSPSPFKNVGRGVADNGIEQQKIINTLFATFVDMLKLAVYSPTVVDDTALVEPEEVDEGIYPGMIIKTFGKKADDVFSKPRYDSNPGQFLFQTIEKLSLSLRTGAGVDVSSSNPSARARISATEISSNVNRSEGSVLTLGRTLDNNFIKPLIRKVVAYRLQYGFDVDTLEDLKMQGVLTESEFNLIKQIPKIERYNEIKRNFKIEIKGFRQRIERQVFLSNVNEFLEQVSKLPPEIQQKLEWKHILQDIAEAYTFDKDRWIVQNNPRDAAEEENRLLAIGKQVSILPDEPHALHLQIHSDELLRSASEGVLQHMLGHIQMALELGQPLPELPPEVMQVLGLQPQQEQQQLIEGPATIQ
jgi:hypothetical protein